ncbi:OmpA family protein [Tatumella ptyseos]|nr:OmpA family protein [Tatumella ptyseos]SQK72814.1 Outer membrane protein ArfA [Tatumella ptyseos]
MPSAVIAPLSLPDDGTGWFDPGSSTITGTRYQTLAALLPALRRTSQYPVLIVGYTDNTGTAAGNRYLSLRRAESVRDWLVANSEFPSSHFIVDGAGETRPITTNDSQQGRAGNRRIEIIPLYPHLFQVNKDYD